MKIRKQDEELLLYSQGQLAFLTSQRQRKYPERSPVVPPKYFMALYL